MSEYTDDAEAIVIAVGNIRNAVVTNGLGTVSVMMILGELMNLTATVNVFNTLPPEKRDEFFCEVWDSAIGNEPHALVTKAGIFEGDQLEAISDGVKAAALSYFNKTVSPPA